MSSFYYLVASLPTLKTNGENPMDYGKFLSQCKNAVPESVYSTLENLTLESDETPFLKKWSDFYKKLTHQVNCLRHEKLGQPCDPSMDCFADIKVVASDAMNASDPLEAEKILLEAQFNFLDEIVNFHYFDECVLLGYALKLKLLERRNVFVKQDGSEEFRRLFENIRQQIMNI